jgi:hypothetical protein
MLRKSLWILILFACSLDFVYAEDVSSGGIKSLQASVQKLTQMVEALNVKMDDQQKRIEQLESENADLRSQIMQGQEVSGPITENPAPPAPQGIWSGGFKQGLQAFNPEIGVVVDIVAAVSGSKEDEEGNDRLSIREIELVFGHDIDPYARFDGTFTLSDFEDPDIEEAYVTYWGLPFELKGRVGRMRPKVGKASAAHRDSLETVDEPLVVQNYFGVEGLFRTGLELSLFLPLPWEILTHELTAGIMEGGIGEDGTLFGETRRRPSFYVHLKNFWDISDTTNLELGGTYLLGSSDEDSGYEVNAFGIDLTLIHYLNAVNRLKIQSEFYLQDRDEPFIDAESGEEVLDAIGEEMSPASFDDNPWGLYTLMDYHLALRWSIGGRFDYVIPTDIASDSPEDADMAFSSYLTFHQSEFSRWRLQYQHVEFADGDDDDRVFLQGTFAIGVHKHQLQ